MTRPERIDRTKLWLFKCALRSLAALGAYDLLAWVAARHVTERRNNENVPVPKAGRQSGRDTVLVLDSERFRGDLDIFSREEDIRILCISWPLLRHLLASFVHQPTACEKAALPPGLSPRLAFATAEPGSRTARERECYRSFLQRFLPCFFERLGVDLTMNSDYRFRREHDVIQVAAELGYPHICYFREAMYIVPATYKKAVRRYRAMAPFRGSVIAVQNEVTGQIFVDAGMTEPERIVVRGCPRMDGFLHRLRQGSLKKTDKKRQVAFFSWPTHVPLGDGTKFDLLGTAAAVVRALAEMARDDPTLQVVLKMKDQHMKGKKRGQMSRFRDVVREVAGEEGALPNVVFETKRMAAHAVIEESDVICAMQTTVVLEAAVARKHVVLPHFDDITSRPGADQVLMYQEYRHLFDRPIDAEHLKSIIRQRLAGPEVDEDIVAERRALFECHVSPLSADATNRSLDLIRRLAGRGRDKTGGGPESCKAAAVERTAKQDSHAHVFESLALNGDSECRSFVPITLFVDPMGTNTSAVSE